MRPLVAGPDGDLRVVDGLRPAARSGRRLFALRPRDCVPLPPGATLARLPGRAALAIGPDGRPAKVADGIPVAAILPVGWVRTLLPASEPQAGAPRLPLYGYTAVAEHEGEVVVAAERTDDFAWWSPSRFARPELAAAVEAMLRALPGNRVAEQLAVCALEHNCYTAQNTVWQRFEGALPSSPACNADCLGCLSLQSDGAAAPQPRIRFAPTADELVAVAERHLAGPRARIVSFGQGCEGEPLVRADALVEATRRIKATHPEATVHVNTNGSNPEALERLLRAGVTSVRISAISFTEPIFAAYYRPVGYGLEEVEACGRLARSAGAQVCLNLLTFPGLTDSPEELERTVDACRRMGVHQIQWRTLNVDHDWLLSLLPDMPPGMGIGAARCHLARVLPQVAHGNFTRPWPDLLPVQAEEGERAAAGGSSSGGSVSRSDLG